MTLLNDIFKDKKPNGKTTKKGNKRKGAPAGARLGFDATPSKSPKNKIAVSWEADQNAGFFILKGRYGGKQLRGKSHQFSPDLYGDTGRPDTFGKVRQQDFLDLAYKIWDHEMIKIEDTRKNSGGGFRQAPKRVVDEVKKQTAALIKKLLKK